MYPTIQSILVRWTVVSAAGLCFILYTLSSALKIPAAHPAVPPPSAQPAANPVVANQSVPDAPEPENTSAVLEKECNVSDRFPQEILQWCALITHYAAKRNLPPDLVAALIWIESAGNASAYSHSGAVGLMQVMPRDGLAASFTCVGGPCFSDRPSSDQLYDPAFNISYGTKLLAGLVARNGNLREALKSYGPMSVGYSYADQVLGVFKRYAN